MVSGNIRARSLLGKGQRVLVAVSAGVDSMVLFHILHKFATINGWQLTIAHLNHRLRGRSSDADERLVRQTAKKLKLPIVVESADVRKLARRHKLSLEMAARKLRHDFLARTALRLGIPVVALAHHADDQLELFFLRLLRGSGGEGLSGMNWKNPSPSDPGIDLIRPLLDQPKSALLEYAAANKVPYREDATNSSLDIQRNLIRHELLPLLRKKYQPALDKTILRVMEIIGAEVDFVSDASSKYLAGKRGQNRSGPRLSSAAARKQNTDLRRRRRSSAFGRAAAEDAEGSGLRSTRGPASSERFDALPVALQRRCLHIQLVKHCVKPVFRLNEEVRLHADRPVSIPDLNRNSLATSSHTSRTLVSRDSAGLVQIHTAKLSEFRTQSLPISLNGKERAFEFAGVHFAWKRVPGKFLGLPKHRLSRELFDGDRV